MKREKDRNGDGQERDNRGRGKRWGDNLKTDANRDMFVCLYHTHTHTQKSCRSTNIIRNWNRDIPNKQTERRNGLLSSQHLTSLVMALLLTPTDRTLPAAAVMENHVCALIVHYLPSASLLSGGWLVQSRWARKVGINLKLVFQEGSADGSGISLISNILRALSWCFWNLGKWLVSRQPWRPYFCLSFTIVANVYNI